MKGLSKGRYDETFAGEDVEDLTNVKSAEWHLHRKTFLKVILKCI